MLDDESFDALYPRTIRGSSRRHWTPFHVVVRALELLELDEGSRVLDIGSGSGKFCLIGALRTRARFVGVEQREPLVRLSRAMARRFRVERVAFHHALVEQLDWTPFDRLYFYNPFGECHLASEERLPFAADLSDERFQDLIRTARSKLECLPVGARVVTFHGLGGPMPEGYRCVAAEVWDDGILKCWLRDDLPGLRGMAADTFEDLADGFSSRPRRA